MPAPRKRGSGARTKPATSEPVHKKLKPRTRDTATNEKRTSEGTRSLGKREGSAGGPEGTPAKAVRTRSVGARRRLESAEASDGSSAPRRGRSASGTRAAGVETGRLTVKPSEARAAARTTTKRATRTRAASVVPEVNEDARCAASTRSQTVPEEVELAGAGQQTPQRSCAAEAKEQTAGMPQGSKATFSKKEVIPMKKRPYRAVPVKQINLEELTNTIKGRRLIVGVDVAKEKMRAALMTEERQSLVTVKWEHPRETRDFLSLLKALPASSIELVMEPSGTYGHVLMHQASDCSSVSLVSGKKTHDAAEVFDGVPSTHDGKCAQIIARLHLEGASRPWSPEPDCRRDMKAAVSTMERYQRRHLDNVNRVEANLARMWPELLKLCDLTNSTWPALLATFPGPSAVQAKAEAAAELMRVHSRGFLSEDLIRAVIESSKNSLGVPMTNGEREALRDLAEDTLSALSATQKAATRVRALRHESETAMQLAPFAGAATAVVLTAAVGEVQDYEHPGAYLKALGLNLREKSSGESTGGMHITKRGSNAARLYLYFLTLRVIKRDAVVRAWYRKKVERDGGKKMKALIAVMRKLAKALWHLGRGAEFDARKLFDVSILNVSANVATPA